MQSKNSPCGCGSGKKYKLCCLPADEQRMIEFQAAEDAELDLWLQEDIRLGQQYLAEVEWNRQYPHGVVLGEIHELPDGSTQIPVIAKEA